DEHAVVLEAARQDCRPPRFVVQLLRFHLLQYRGHLDTSDEIVRSPRVPLLSGSSRQSQLLRGYAASSIACRRTASTPGPTIAIAKAPGRNSRCATRWTSAGVTAAIRSTTSSNGSISPNISSDSPARWASDIVDSRPRRKLPVEKSRA